MPTKIQTTKSQERDQQHLAQTHSNSFDNGIDKPTRDTTWEIKPNTSCNKSKPHALITPTFEIDTHHQQTKLIFSSN